VRLPIEIMAILESFAGEPAPAALRGKNMRHILFVDDEPRLLEGLQRMFRAQRQHWEMSFVTSGADALAMLASRPCDVIVTDMRMPGMDGATLLEQVQERYPGVVRIVLSGEMEMEAALRAAPVAHQFLSKPCDAEKLRETIERACDCRGKLNDEGIRQVIGAVGRLPSQPATCASLIAAVQDPDINMGPVAQLIESDVGIAAKVLQLVSSAFFGRRNEVRSVREAVNYLGLETLKQLVLSVEILRTFQPPYIRGFALKDFEAHSRLAAGIAAQLPAPNRVASTAVVAALLHDTGKLVLATRLPGQFELALRTAQERAVPLHTVEEDLLGTGHAEVGAYLLELWGLPGEIVEAVLKHHRPVTSQPPGHELTVPTVTYLANALANELCGSVPGDGSPSLPLVDPDYVAALGMTEQLPFWRVLARQALGES
jgi:HD-like signal output (HDOD) protein/ActR/RegA family two-component response regulator